MAGARMMTPILDSQISRALIQPTAWETAQYRQAALRDRADWSALIDIAGSHRFSDDAQRCVDVEIRRAREALRCGGSPTAVVMSCTPPSELARLEHYNARVLFTWLRPDYRAESGGKITSLGDKVALVAEGAVAPNARSVVPSHMFSQISGTNQTASPSLDASLNNRETAVFTGAQRYSSTLAPADIAFSHDGSPFSVLMVFIPKNAAAAQFYFGNTHSDTVRGTYLWHNAAAAQARVTKTGGPASPLADAGNIVLNTPTYLYFAHSAGSPNYEARLKGVAGTSGLYTSTPDAGASLRTWTLGDALAGGSGFGSAMAFADLLIANTRSAVVSAAALRYVARRYPVLA